MVGWSTEKTEEKANNQSNRDTEEVVSWRSINQGEIDDCWEITKWRIAREERIEEEVSLRSGG